jgi:hypothetical protein
MPPSLDRDATAILARLKHEGITALYHFTSVENLLGICQMGALCSKQRLEDAHRWPCPVPGGKGPSHSLDRSIGNWDKVSLNLTPHTPMAYWRKREQHLCFILVNPKVATWSGVVFTNSNAAGTTNQLRSEGLAGLNNIKFDVVRSIPRPGDREGWLRPVQAEVLVPDSIPFAYVSEVAFVSNASMNYAQDLCKSFAHPTFSVKAQMFTDSPRALQTAINFAYVKEFVLTDPKNVSHMVYLKKNKYSKAADDHVKVVAKVSALSGAEGRVLLCSNSSKVEVVAEREFPRQSEYPHMCDISLNRLPVGRYFVKYFLGDVCWSMSNFEVVP